MVAIKDKHVVYLRNKLDDYIERFGTDGFNRYKDFYDNTPVPLNIFFSMFHFHFNHLFKYLNTRLNTGHYTADESRDLIYLIEEFQTVQSDLEKSAFNFDINSYYKEKLIECESFLQRSGGSPIPYNFEKVKTIEMDAIFHIKSAVTMTRSTEKFSFPTQVVGRGSYAEVLKYKDTNYKRTFAIKKAFNDLTAKEYDRFRIEFEEMKKLKSPYVLEVYTYDSKNKQYIMEYVKDTLDTLITKNNSTLDKTKRINLLKQIFEAFVYINSKNILHRDISPCNILVKDYDGLKIIKVSDFGLVKRQGSQLTSQNSDKKGSFNDPKLDLIGFDKYEIRHETYALTRLVYFVMTGNIRLKPFQNVEFEAFIRKGLADNINERYNSVSELRDAFNKIKHTL